MNGFWHDTGIVFSRHMRRSLRNPLWVFIGLAQPLIYLFLFGPLLEPLAGALGTSNAYTLFVPGLLVQLGIFGSLFVGFDLVAEWRAGVIESERVTPANRTSLLLGRILRDVLVLAVQGVILIGVGFAIGMRGSLPGMLFGLAITLLLGAACASTSNAIALSTKSEDVLAPLLNSIALPVLLLSGILLPISLATGAPQWLVTVSDIIPTKHIVDAIRIVFSGADYSLTVLWGSLWAAVLAAAGIWFGTRTFRRENA